MGSSGKGSVLMLVRACEGADEKLFRAVTGLLPEDEA